MILHYKPDNGCDQWGTGGGKRSYQIQELLQNNFEVINRSEIKTNFGSRYQRIKNGFKAYFKLKNNYVKISDIFYLGYLYTSIENLLLDYPKIKCVLWEGIFSGHFFIPYIFKLKSIPVLSFPHNIESLVQNQKWLLGFENTNRFQQELSQFKACFKTYTISREEQWLLQLNNINCEYFPYYSSKETTKYLLDIRKKREYSKKDFFLVIGSFFYPPTRKGIISIVNQIIESKAEIKVKIAGFKSEEISGLIKDIPNNLEILGTVSNNLLKELYINCKAIILNQEVSTGALTKLLEFQLAGIPVISNAMSLRSYHNIKGLYAIEQPDKIIKNIEQKLEIPELPISNDLFDKKIIDDISSIIENKNQ